MSSTPSKTEAPTPPVFSYAQAAKGRAPSIAPSAVQSSQTTSGVSTPHKDAATAARTPSVSSEKGAGSINGSQEATSSSDTQGESSSMESRSLNPSKNESVPASPSAGTVSASTLPKEDKDDDFTLVGGPSDHGRDRHAHTGHNEKASEEKEGRRNKKSKKQKNAEKEAEKEKEKEEVKPEILVPAPIPAVNFWAQRKEDAAKLKPSSVSISNSSDNANGEAKKGGNPIGAEEGVKNLGGLAKFASNAGKAQKKGNEISKVKEDQVNKRAGPRGGRVTEKDDKPQVTSLPPPVEDAMSWPTPETALEEEKRKAQEKPEKEEKDEGNANKQPRPKKDWVAMPFVPTVSFNTPIPPRGGRGRGGARGGRADTAGRSSNGQTVEKTAAASTTASSPSAEGHTGKDAGMREASLPPNPNRQADQTTPRSQRKNGTTATPDKSKTDVAKNEPAPSSEIRNAPTDATLETTLADSQAARGDDLRAKQDQSQGHLIDGQLQPRSARQSEPSLRGSEGGFGKDSNQIVREGRPDRGRGGYRNRGNFANGQHAFANGHPPLPNGYPVRQSPGPYSPPLQHQPFSNQYTPPPRAGRGAARSQSIPNSGMYPQYRPNGPPQHMAPLQASNMFEYSMQAMSGGPYNPYIDSVSLLAMVTMQLEYYFSIDNLCKDVFLRKHMDGQGYVFLSFIAGFKRIQSLTSDFELLRYACQESEIIELVRGSDGIDRLRRREGWEKWVLAIEERDDSARNAGPEYVMRATSQRGQPMPALMGPNHPAMSPPAYSPNGVEQTFRPYANGAPSPQYINGGANGYHPETPLSAAVPDFAPALVNGGLENARDPLEAEVTFNDEEVTHLTLVFASPKGSEGSKPKLPFHNSSSRTFSNGSIDGRSIAEEMHDDSRQGRTLTNGALVSENSPEAVRRSRSPFSPLSPTRSVTGNGPPVMWVKGQRQQVSEHTEELYTDFRARALQKRELSTAGETHADMKLLYEFWSHFLCRNFNLTMYNEFRKYAFEDARNHAQSGMKNLISYYDEVLNSKKKVIPETLARHYVDIVRSEETNDRPAFEKLRAAWRNGALDMKSRKKIDNLVDPKLRDELERAPRQKSVS